VTAHKRAEAGVAQQHTNELKRFAELWVTTVRGCKLLHWVVSSSVGVGVTL
jgi:hypothetical protein